MDKQVKE